MLKQKSFIKLISIMIILLTLFLPLEQLAARNEVVTVPVLMYHHFAKQGTSSLRKNIVVAPQQFEEQLLYLKKKGYHTIDNQDLLAFLNGEKELPEKPILITIDDGYGCIYKYAYPVLKKLNMKATIYAIVSGITDKFYSDFSFPKLSWKQIKEMYSSGLIDIQSHTYAMHFKVKGANGKRALLTGPVYQNGSLETPKEYEDRVLEDLLKSKTIIEQKLGNEVITLCYPYGAFNKTAIRFVKDAGFKMALTVRPGLNAQSQNPYEINRINVPGSYTGKDIVEVIEKYK